MRRHDIEAESEYIYKLESLETEIVSETCGKALKN